MKKNFANEENRFYIKSEKKSYIHFQIRPNNAPALLIFYALLIFCSLATRFNGVFIFFFRFTRRSFIQTKTSIILRQWASHKAFLSRVFVL